MENHVLREAQESEIATDTLEKEGKQSLQGNITIKGTRNGLLLTLEAGTPFRDLLKALSDRLAESPTFFRGASLTVDTSQRALHTDEQLQLENLLAHYQMSVISTTQTYERKESKTINLSAPINTPRPVTHATIEFDQSQRDPRDTDDTLYLRRTIRSGQAIQHQSNIVILGDVNPGAEIIAGGDIIVWGTLRGLVHAGYPDNEQAMVCSLQLAPVQLRIAHLLSRPPEGFEAQIRPEIATIRQGQIIVETWTGGRTARR